MLKLKQTLIQQPSWLMLSMLFFVGGLSGCGGSGPTPDNAPVAGTAEQIANTKGSIVMDFSAGNIPFPHNALFSESEDATLNIPVANANDFSDPAVAMNTLDGFSTSAPITFTLSKDMDTTDANANQIADVLETSVALYPANTSMENGARVVKDVQAALSLGLDYVVSAVNAKTVAILPTQPLKPKQTYLVVVNQQLLDADGQSMVKSLVYNGLSGSESLRGTSLEALEPLRQLTQAHLDALKQSGVDVTEVIGSWSFTTQSTSDVLTSLQDNLSTSGINLANTTLDTATFSGQGLADIYSGAMHVPYYLKAPSENNPTAPLNSFWQGSEDSFLTQSKNTPIKNSEQTIPVLFTLPNSNTGLTEPANGWPVVIFQHGISQNRGNLLAVADSLAQAGFAAIAIDMPLHGINPTSDLAGLRSESVSERHFDIDYVTQDGNGDVIANTPDEVVDSSGRHFINLQSLLTTRDNLRQAVADLMALKAGLAQITGLTNTSIDSTQIAFVGHSLGGMVGGLFTQLVGSELHSAVFAMSGTQAAYLLAGSPTFGPEIEAGLAQQNVQADSAEFNQFIRAAQTVIDSADPVNYVASINTPSLMLEVVGDGTDISTADQVVPNQLTTAPLAGTEPWIRLQNLATLDSSGVVAGKKGVLRFTQGTHSALLDPSSNVTVFTTMQEAMASFVKTQGAAIAVSDTSTIQTLP